MYNRIKYNLNTHFYIENNKTKKLIIELVGIRKITNLKGMFCECTSLIESLPDISKWNNNNITDRSFLFAGCSSLKSLPDISKWNTSHLINMKCLFY